MNELRVTTLDDVEALLLRSFYSALPESKSGIEMPKLRRVPRVLCGRCSLLSGQGRTRPDWDRQFL